MIVICNTSSGRVCFCITIFYLTSKKRCRVSKWLGGVSSAVLSKPSLFTEFMSMPSSLSRAKRYPRALCVTMSWAVFPRLFRIAVLAPNTSKCFRASLRLISNRSLSRSEFELSSQWRTDSPWRNYTYENLNKNHGRWHKPIYTHHSQWYIVNEKRESFKLICPLCFGTYIVVDNIWVSTIH